MYLDKFVRGQLRFQAFQGEVGQYLFTGGINRNIVTYAFNIQDIGKFDFFDPLSLFINRYEGCRVAEAWFLSA